MLLSFKKFNPLKPGVSISILLAGCHTFVVVLVGRSCSNMKEFIPGDQSDHTCALNCALILPGEI